MCYQPRISYGLPKKIFDFLLYPENFFLSPSFSYILHFHHSQHFFSRHSNPLSVSVKHLNPKCGSLLLVWSIFVWNDCNWIRLYCDGGGLLVGFSTRHLPLTIVIQEVKLILMATSWSSRYFSHGQFNWVFAFFRIYQQVCGNRWSLSLN